MTNQAQSDWLLPFFELVALWSGQTIAFSDDWLEESSPGSESKVMVYVASLASLPNAGATRSEVLGVARLVAGLLDLLLSSPHIDPSPDLLLDLKDSLGQDIVTMAQAAGVGMDELAAELSRCAQLADVVRLYW